MQKSNSKQKYLVVIETAQKQHYIFNSNRLKENIGASYLIAQATGTWCDQAVKGTDAKTIYSGGGNFAARFPDNGSAKKFIRELSHRVALEAPHLHINVGMVACGEDDVQQKLKDAFKAAQQHGASRTPAAPMLGLGVTRVCRSTGLPAVALDGDYPISAAIKAKLRAANQSHHDLRQRFLSQNEAQKIDFPRDFDDLGRSEGKFSYIALVHADGDGFGKAFLRLGESQSYVGSKFLTAETELSQGVVAATEQAFRQLVNLLISRITYEDGIPFIESVPLKEEGDLLYLPFRPIVLAGDDITFVCDGRLGITLAAAFLSFFEEACRQQIPEEYLALLEDDEMDGSPKFTACAGVSIVKSHYPFARAYLLAEELAKSAKAFRKEAHEYISCLDWHMETNGILDPLDAMRDREYSVEAGSLNLRPVSLGENRYKSYRSWITVQRAANIFKIDWIDKHNKVKTLRDALRGGPDGVRQFLINFPDDQLKPAVDGIGANNGWYDGHCLYYDAIELLDWYAAFSYEPAAE